MKALNKIVMVLALCALVLPAAAADAKNNKGHGHGKKDDVIIWNDDNGHGNAGKGGKHVSSKDIDILRGYVIGQYKRNCPPGLAKKNPPCIPPGQAKKYGAGTVLPEGGFSWVPKDIVSLLTPPPPHGRYVRVDKNIYLINEGTRKVLEAIELFSAID